MRQHPFRAAVPMHPQQEMTKSITPIPIKEYKNLHVENVISKHLSKILFLKDLSFLRIMSRQIQHPGLQIK